MTLMLLTMLGVVSAINQTASRIGRRLGLTSGVPDELGFDPQEHRDAISTGYPIGPNTFAHEVRKAMLELQDKFDIRFPIIKDPEPTLRSNPLRVNDKVPKLRGQMIARRRLLADYVNGMMHIYSNGGTGWLLWKRVADDLNLGASIDWLVQTHHLQRPGYRQEGDPVARRRLCAALGYAYIDAGTLLMDQPIQKHGYAGVPREVAKIVMTAGHFDWGDLENGIHTVGHTTVPVPEQGLQAGKADQDQIVGEAIQHQANNTDFLFDPAHWAYWRDFDEDRELPLVDRTERRAVVPREYEAVDGAGVDIEPIHADVEQPHVLIVRRIGDEWIEQLQQEAIAHIDELIRAGDNSVAAEWENMCEKFGVDDPLPRWEAFRRNHVDPRLE
jgi:hypothetical protein